MTGKVALRASAGFTPPPIGIGAFSLGKGKKVEGKKAEGKNGKFVALCDKCGWSGHTADQCLTDHACSKCKKKSLALIEDGAIPEQV